MHHDIRPPLRRTAIACVVALALGGGGLVALVEPVAPPSCGGHRPTIVGTPASDVLQGTEGRDVIHALGGDDTIDGLGGDDVVCGGAGRDVVLGETADGTAGSGTELAVGAAG